MGALHEGHVNLGQSEDTQLILPLRMGCVSFLPNSSDHSVFDSIYTVQSEAQNQPIFTPQLRLTLLLKQN